MLANPTSSHQVEQIDATLLESVPDIEFLPSKSFRQLDREFKSVPVEELCRHEPVDREIRVVSLDQADSTLAIYLAELHRVPLLSQQEEYEMFRWMNYLKYRAARLLEGRQKTSAKLDREVNLLLDRAKQVRNRIVSANLRLVVSIAKKLTDARNPLEDLVSDGNLPLIRAVEIFDYERGLKFSTYATWAIRNSLFRSTPRNRKHAQRFATGMDELFPSVEEERDSIHSQESYHHDVRNAITLLLDDLDDREKIILESRFGLNDEQKPFRFREIAETLGVSTERVRQLLARSLNRLREKSESLAIEVA